MHFCCYFFPLQIALQEHPEVESIRFKGCLVYEQLHRIFSDLESDGKSAFAATTQVLVLFDLQLDFCTK